MATKPTEVTTTGRLLPFVGVGVVLGLAVAFRELRWILFGLGLIAGIVYARRTERWLLAVLGVGLSLRVVLILVDVQLGFVPRPSVADQHHARTMALLDSWAKGLLFEATFWSDGMEALVAHALAPFYVLFGSVQVAGRLAVAFYGTLIGVPVYLIARRLADRRMAIWASLLVLVWPSLLVRSTMLQREAILSTVMLVLVFVAVDAVRGVTLLDIVVFLPTVALVYLLREQNLIIVGGLLLALLLLRIRSWTLRAATVLTGSLLGFAFVDLWFDRIGRFGNVLSPALVDAYAHARAHGSTAYLVDFHYRSWLDIVFAVPVKVVYYLFSPMPWQVSDLATVFAGIAGWALLGACLLAIRGIRAVHDRSGELAILLTYLAVGVVPYAIVEMNAGAAFRRRIQFVPVILILAIIGLSSYRLSVSSSDPAEGEGSKDPVVD